MFEEIDQLDWLIVVLVYNHQYYDELHSEVEGYISMEDQKRHLFHSVEDIIFSQNIKVVLIENRLSFTGTPLALKEIVNITETDGPELVTILRDDKTQSEALTKQEKAAKILKTTISRYPAKRHILITFGHGSIFGINYMVAPDSIQPKKNDKALKEFASEVTPTKLRTYTFSSWDYSLGTINDAGISLEHLRDTAFKKGANKADTNNILHDISKRVILTNQELNEVIKEAMGGTKKLDILVMYNCLMQNLYMQYELKDSVDFLVAPISGICHPGYNYRGVLGKLLLDSNKPNKEIADLFLDTIREDTEYYPKFQEDIESSWKICSVKLERNIYEGIKAGFADFVAEILRLHDQTPNVFMCLNNTLNQCFNYACTALDNDQTEIDLWVFLQYLSHKIETGFPSLTSLQQLADQLISQLSSVQSHCFIGKSFFPANVNYVDEQYEKKFGFGFLLQKTKYPLHTIQSDTFSSPDSEYLPSFLRDTGFLDFYTAYTQFNELS